MLGHRRSATDPDTSKTAVSWFGGMYLTDCCCGDLTKKQDKKERDMKRHYYKKQIMKVKLPEIDCPVYI